MKIRHHRESFASLESIAITDIILNMFIFFFTAFSLVYTFNPSRESRIQIKLPQADIKTPVEQSDPLIITIRGRNEIFLGSRSKTLRDLRTELQSMTARNKERPVVIYADKRVVFDDLVQVLEVTKNAGVKTLGIAVEEKTARPSQRP
jgi:biopolymer transport protein ExbD